MKPKYDFCGYVTKNDIRCSDGRTIRHGAFKEQDGTKVPLVWQHQHNDPMNVIGNVILENRNDGVYGYGSFNKSDMANSAKIAIDHGDINAMSIYANQLQQRNGNVLHGVIREVSLVLAGANPGALIDFPVLAHSGEEIEDEAIIYTDEILSLSHEDDTYEDIDNANNEELKHEDNPHKKDLKEGEEKMADNEKTVQDVFDELTEEQKTVVYALIGQAVEDAMNGEYDEEYDDEEGDEDMKHNVFDSDYENPDDVLSHAEITEIFADAKRGTLSEAVLSHGIENVDYLFPDAQNYQVAPDWVKRDTDWVDVFMNGVHHTPFSKVKSLHGNITADEARARGYVKGNFKAEEVVALLKRQTSPCTIYKKQKLDRDDIVDITDFDVVAWLKGEMRIMLDEEIARAALIGDGRTAGTDDKISEDCVRPIWKDSNVYAINQVISHGAAATAAEKAEKFIDEAVRARKNYKGSGNPVMFMTEDLLTECLLLKDTQKHRIYKTEAELATAMRVSKIVTVPVMESQTREVGGKTRVLAGIALNLNDYNIGADKGGAVGMFDDFDIDYNAQKYLIETRCSGALIKPYSAIVLEFEQTA